MHVANSGQYNTENSRAIALQEALDTLGSEAEIAAKSLQNILAILGQIKDKARESSAVLKDQDHVAETIDEKTATDFRSITGLEFISQNGQDPIDNSTDITAILSILNDALEKVNDPRMYNEILEEPVLKEVSQQEYAPANQNITASPIENAEIEKELQTACRWLQHAPAAAALVQANQSAERFSQLIGR